MNEKMRELCEIVNPEMMQYNRMTTDERIAFTVALTKMEKSSTWIPGRAPAFISTRSNTNGNRWLIIPT